MLKSIRPLIALLLLLSPACTSPPEPPNIILIMADDLGYETLGINGSTSYKTPHLDALARSGMRFTQAYSTPLCTPSRVQIMTGKYNFRNYIGFGLLDPDERTFAHWLKDAGYRTAVTGKWQLYGNPRQRELFGRSGSLPEQAGFDEYLLWQIQDRGLRFKNPVLYAPGEPAKTFDGAYGPDLFADFIEGFMERHQDTPFFLYYPMALTHDPFQPTPDHPEYANFDPASGVNDPVYFASNVTYMDKIIGRIMNSLDRLGIRNHTMVLFVGDNGTDRDITSQFEGQDLRGNKGFTNAAGTHVPMIASWPDTIEPGQINDNLIDFTDFLPTLMDAAQATLPDTTLTDGLSFYPQLYGQADTTRNWVFCHYAPQWGDFIHRRYVHDRSWKLYDDGSFYHLAVDWDESDPIPDSAMTLEMQHARDRFQHVLNRMQP